MTTTATKSRLHTMYMEQVAPKLMKEFGLTNINQVPVIEKVIVNTGVGKQLENQKLKPEIRDTVYDTYRKITGQKAVMTIAKKSVSNFKVREGAPSGFMVTLRRDKMWSFLDRLMNLAIPRIKDFRGVSRSPRGPLTTDFVGSPAHRTSRTFSGRNQRI